MGCPLCGHSAGLHYDVDDSDGDYSYCSAGKCGCTASHEQASSLEAGKVP